MTFKAAALLDCSTRRVEAYTVVFRPVVLNYDARLCGVAATLPNLVAHHSVKCLEEMCDNPHTKGLENKDGFETGKGSDDET